MKRHISNVCKISYFHLRNVRYLKPVLSNDALVTVVHAFISSRLDYCNSLLHGLPENQVFKLQRIQNVAARLVTGCARTDHISPVLKILHWLPIRYRIDFKILLLTYKCIHGLGPEYLSELISVKECGRSLRSSHSLNLSVPKHRLKSYGERSFSVAAPKLWNNLPCKIKSSESVAVFKSAVKTHMFSLAFSNV